MRLADYIAKMGPDHKFAELVGVARRTVADWRTGNRRPRPEQAQVIVKRTKGLVSMADIYGPSK